MHSSLKNIACFYFSFVFKWLFVKFQIEILFSDLINKFSWKLVLVQNSCQIFEIVTKTFLCVTNSVIPIQQSF